MTAPRLTFSVTGNMVSSVGGFDRVKVKFTSDIPYIYFECRAAKSGEPWGRGKGTLIASFPQTPANTEREFEICGGSLINGDGAYIIGLFAQGTDGSWNDNQYFITGSSSGFETADGKIFLCMR